MNNEEILNKVFKKYSKKHKAEFEFLKESEFDKITLIPMIKEALELKDAQVLEDGA